MKLFRLPNRCAALVAALAFPIWLAAAQAATRGQPGQPDPAPNGYSAAALFNQANADARSGKTGPAILNYERALLLAPNDADVAANLHVVRSKAGLPDAPESRLAHALALARPNTLAWLGSFGLVLGGVGVLLARVRPRRRLAFRALAVVGALLVATALGGAITVWPRIHEAVVIAHTAAARTSPVLAAEPAFTLREGETVAVRAEHRDFVLVQTPAGRSGWVARPDLARVVPRSSRSPRSLRQTWLSL